MAGDLEEHEQHHIIDISKQSQLPNTNHSQRRRTDQSGSDLPIFNPRSGPGKREFNQQLLLRSRFSKKLIHAIPVLVFICIFALWWFSYPVNLEFKDGRIIEVHRIEHPHPIDELESSESNVDLTILAWANPPYVSVPLILPANNHTELQQPSRSKTD